MTDCNITLVMGDWSYDGHGKTETISVLSSKGLSAVIAAYKKGVQAVGLDLTDEVACDYEDSTLSAEHLATLVAAGYQIEGLEEAEGEPVPKDYQYLSTDQFVDMWLFIVRKGDPDLRIEVGAQDPTINIGGYGLFGS
jgi:hypothetical protein